MTDSLSKIAAKTLGDSTSYAVFTDKFDASLLNPMPREIARKGHGIKGDEFLGHDLWTCHESTFLLDNGLPVAGTLRFSYDCSSEYMIESKSAKLYLNSFDMCKMGKTHERAIENYQNQVKADLEKVLGTEVKLRFYSNQGYKQVSHRDLLAGYTDLIPETSTDPYYNTGNSVISTDCILNMTFDDYSGQGHHLESIETGSGAQHKYFTNILRSRCRHTKQKDTGTAAIAYSSTRLISPPSILKQIVSLREVNEFHEFCAEKLFCEFRPHLNEHDALNVTLLYSRRGSLDINPVRYVGKQGFDSGYAYDPGVGIVTKTQGQ